VAGSTRLKAGTATKLVLNMLTTGAMIRIGKSYGNLMVDLRATNVKLQDRAERIVCEVTGLPRDDAQTLLQHADGRVKRALVMHALQVDAATADARLADVGGVIRKVLPEAPPAVPVSATGA
jgi:N-acetylmuramic acid 6-phosphate etherase